MVLSPDGVVLVGKAFLLVSLYRGSVVSHTGYASYPFRSLQRRARPTLAKPDEAGSYRTAPESHAARQPSSAFKVSNTQAARRLICSLAASPSPSRARTSSCR